MTIQDQLLKLLPEKENEYGVTIEDNMKIRGFNQAIDIMEERIKTLRVDEEKLYKFLKSIKACNIENKDTDWCEIVNVRDLAKAICSSNILTGGEK